MKIFNTPPQHDSEVVPKKFRLLRRTGRRPGTSAMQRVLCCGCCRYATVARKDLFGWSVQTFRDSLDKRVQRRMNEAPHLLIRSTMPANCTASDERPCAFASVCQLERIVSSFSFSCQCGLCRTAADTRIIESSTVLRRDV